MKKKKAGSQSAFFKVRTLLAVTLVLVAVLLGLFASGGISLSRFATLGIQRGSGASAAISKVAGDVRRSPLQPVSKPDATAPNDLNGVTPAKIDLREAPMIPPDLAPHREAPEPVSPPLPSDAGAVVEKTRKTFFGAVTSAPTATGISFEGVGVGIPESCLREAIRRIQTVGLERLNTFSGIIPVSRFGIRPGICFTDQLPATPSSNRSADNAPLTTTAIRLLSTTSCPDDGSYPSLW